MDILAIQKPLCFSFRIKHKQRMSLFQDSHARGIFFLITLLLATTQVSALDAGEVIALKDMQAEWGTQLGWTGSPSCNLWNGVYCNLEGHVFELYVLFQFHRATNPHQTLLFQPNFSIFLILFRSLSFNQLNGTIPSSIANLAQLQNLYVHSCFQQQPQFKLTLSTI